MFTGLLPIGSVVLLEGSKKRVMVVGVCQKGVGNGEKIWDYVGVIFPEGFIDAQKMFLFNKEQISQIYALGYQDAEQLNFKLRIDEEMKKIRGEEND